MESCAEKAEELNRLSGQILDAAIETHKVLGGPGLLESIYEEALSLELQIRGLQVARQVEVPIYYKKHRIKKTLVIDLMINDRIILEIKSVEKFNPIFASQLLTYLRLADKPLGLVINFGEKLIKNGFHRIVHNFPE